VSTGSATPSIVGGPSPSAAAARPDTPRPVRRYCKAAVASVRRPALVRRIASRIPPGSSYFMIVTFRAGECGQAYPPEPLAPLVVDWFVKTGSVDTVGQCLFDFGAGMQCPKDRDRNDHGAGQFGRHIGGDAGQPQHVDAQMLSRRSRRLQIGAGVVPQSEIQ